MLARFLGGVAACLGAAGGLAAQQVLPPAPKSTTAQPVAAPAAAPRPGIYPAVNPSPRRAPAARLMAAPAQTAQPPTAPAPKPVPESGPAAPPTPAPQPAAPPAAPAPAAAVPQTTASKLLTTWPSYADCACPPLTACQACCEAPCGPPGKFWVDAGYLFWTTKGQNLPVLATTAPLGTPRATAGVLGDPATSTLFGGGRQNDDWRSGLFVNAGMWRDPMQTRGIEGNFFFLGRDSDRFSAGGAGDTIVTRPFTNALTGAGDTELVSFPGVLQGTTTVSSRTNVIGGGGNFIRNLRCAPNGRLDLLLGYQYFNLRDDVTIREDLTALPAPGARFQIEDRFRTANHFHGGTIGLAAERRFGFRWFVGVRSAVGIGVNHQVYRVDGSTTITPADGAAPQTFAGGLLAQPSNIGRYTQNKFAVLPSVGVKVGAQVTERVRAYVGYDFVYLSSAARAGDQIDLRVNPAQLPPRTNGTADPALPAFQPRTTDFWTQGVRFGVEVRY